MTPRKFVDALASIRLPAVFNPYNDHCTVHDHIDAAIRRRRNLESFIAAALDYRVDTIWIARDLGYRGGRRTGIPMTDDVHLDRIGHLLGGCTLERTTHGPALQERTATVVWEALSRIKRPAVLWNVFPFHPHEPGNQLSNRRHTSIERIATSDFLPTLIKMIKPKTLVAIGRDAQQALGTSNMKINFVRHPSYGGKRDFMDGLLRLYGVHKTEFPNMDA